MKVANIWPVANQSHYKDEQLVMLLAHLLKEYDPKVFKYSHYVIMDNGLFEGAMVSTDIQELIDMAENSGIEIDELVIPDAMNDSSKTIELFENNIETIKRWNHKYTFMFVAQSKTLDDFKHIIEYINKYDLRLSIGIPKFSPFARDCSTAIEIYKSCKHPIHFLGIRNSFSELTNVHKYIRSCDSSQIAFMIKNNVTDVDPITYERKGEPIDLAHDVLNDRTIKTLYKKTMEELDAYGIL